eukprot:SAG22_NODE_261_length_13373_cov_17.745472_6_plen_102_part_00
MRREVDGATSTLAELSRGYRSRRRKTVRRLRTIQQEESAQIGAAGDERAPRACGGALREDRQLPTQGSTSCGTPRLDHLREMLARAMALAGVLRVSRLLVR